MNAAVTSAVMNSLEDPQVDHGVLHDSREKDRSGAQGPFIETKVRSSSIVRRPTSGEGSTVQGKNKRSATGRPGRNCPKSGEERRAATAVREARPTTFGSPARWKSTPGAFALTLQTMLETIDPTLIRRELEAAVQEARAENGGAPADYIPELQRVAWDALSAAVITNDGSVVRAGDADHRFTLQSSAKLVVLIGLLSELGPDRVFRSVGCEPSGRGFSSIARLDELGPIPSNPMVNAGAIALVGQLKGDAPERIAWLRDWAEKLYGERLEVDHDVFESERRTGDRNRSIAYLLKSTGVIQGPVEATLDAYFALCSLDADVAQAARLPAILANGGRDPGSTAPVIDKETADAVVALMATSGMYDESGAHLLHTGLPSKSGVSGIIVAVSPGRAGIAVSSPRVGPRGSSVRGLVVLKRLSRKLGLHFAHTPDA